MPRPLAAQAPLAGGEPPLAGSGGRYAPPRLFGVFVPPSAVRLVPRRFLIMGGRALLSPGSALTPKPPLASVCPSKITYLLTNRNICSVNVLNHGTTICTKC